MLYSHFFCSTGRAITRIASTWGVDTAGIANQWGGRGPNGGYTDRGCGTLQNSLGRIIQAFKSITPHEYVRGVKQYGGPPFPGRLWQWNYYEHVVKNDDDVDMMRQYIIDNPTKSELDRENPNMLAGCNLHRLASRPDEYLMEPT